LFAARRTREAVTRVSELINAKPARRLSTHALILSEGIFRSVTMHQRSPQPCTAPGRMCPIS
jgi:hypothetical protein